MKTELLKKAKELIASQNLTIVLFSLQNEFIQSAKRGVAPLIELVESGKTLYGFHAVDKVVGAGAAFLYCILKVESVHAFVISERALKVFEQNNISVTFDEKVEYIVNRKRDGKCPIEKAVENCKSASDALEEIKKTLKNLNS